MEDENALENFTLDTKNEQRARTAIGIKPDGTVVIYTADESANSAGMDLYDLADMMESLGCETALNLDGGGSTMVGVQYPGYDKCATANTPTDGSMRACANFIFLVREKTQAEEADHLFLYPGAQLRAARRNGQFCSEGSRPQLCCSGCSGQHQLVDQLRRRRREQAGAGHVLV